MTAPQPPEAPIAGPSGSAPPPGPRPLGRKNPRRALWATLRALLAIGLLLGLLLWKDNYRQIVSLFRDFQWIFLVPLFTLAIFLIWISCLKWRLFLSDRGIQASMPRLMALYVIGRFFNNFFPSMIGGDLTRSYLLGRQIDSLSKSFASVFLERLTGFIAVMAIAVIFAMLNPQLLADPVIALPFWCVVALFASITGALLSSRLMGWILKNIGRVSFLDPLSRKIGHVYEDVAFFRTRKRLMAEAFGYSVVFHFFTIVNVYAACRSINFHPSFLDIALITPIISVVSAIPVSLNNIGWQELCFSVMLRESANGYSVGLAVALLFRALVLLQSAIGGILFAFEKEKRLPVHGSHP